MTWSPEAGSPIILLALQKPRIRRLPTSQPQSTAVSHCDPFLLQDMSHSESELDMVARPWLSSHWGEWLRFILAVWLSMFKLWAFQNIWAITDKAAGSPLPQDKANFLQWFLIVQKAWTSLDIVFLVWPKTLSRKEKLSTEAKKRLHHIQQEGAWRTLLNMPWNIKSYTSWKRGWQGSIKGVTPMLPQNRTSWILEQAFPPPAIPALTL